MVYKFNGEYWYADRRSVWKRLRQWLIWVGGWETMKGWRPFIVSATSRLGWMPMPITPLSVFGHRVTFYGWGLQVRLGDAYLVVTFARSDQPLRAYVSRDGTPDAAHIWIAGTPGGIVYMADRARRVREARA